MNKHDITVLVKSQQDLKFIERKVDLYNDYIREQQLQKQHLEQEIKMLKTNLDNFGVIFHHKRI